MHIDVVYSVQGELTDSLLLDDDSSPELEPESELSLLLSDLNFLADRSLSYSSLFLLAETT